MNEDDKILDELFFAELDRRFRQFRETRVVPAMRDDYEFVQEHFYDELEAAWVDWWTNSFYARERR